MITTEGLLTSGDGFRIPTATPVQRAAARVVDGRPLEELRTDPEVIAAFGGPEAVAALPSERGAKPTEFYNVASPRTAKTTSAVAAALTATQTVDVSGLGPGEIPRVAIVSLKIDVADVPFRRLVGTMEASRALRPLLLEKGSDSVLIRTPSGLPMEVAVVAGGKAAGGLTARWLGGLIADEATRMTGRDEAVANLDDLLSVARERLLPGAQIQGIGSPHAPFGPMYELVQTYFGRPTADIVVMRTTGPAGNPAHWTPERLERLREKDESAWRIVALGEFLDPESGLFSPLSVRKNTREAPLELPPEPGASYAAAADVGADRLTVVIVEGYETDYAKDDAGVGLPYYRVACVHEARGGSPDTRWAEVAERCRRYGVRTVVVDQYAAAESAAIAARLGLTTVERRWDGPGRLEAFTNAATLLHTDRIELAPVRQFRSDLLAVKKRTTQTGATIVFPKTRDGRHCDFAPALVAALRAAKERLGQRDFAITWPSRGHARRDYALPYEERSRPFLSDEAT